MHELSIAEMLIDLVVEHAPPNAVVRRVEVEAGPLQAIEPEAMEFAWLAVTDGTALAGSALDVRMTPFEFHCPACERKWDGDDFFAICDCGHGRPRVAGGDKLVLVSIECETDEPDVLESDPPRKDDVPAARNPDGGAPCKSP